MASDLLDKMKCAYCGLEWKPRVKQPRACPACHRYFFDRLGLKKHPKTKTIEARAIVLDSNTKVRDESIEDPEKIKEWLKKVFEADSRFP